ncbi:hypothetical protein Tco_1235564 [Tanacetum coccineum]
MHTHASNSELVESLPEPERTLNRRLRRGNRKVPFEQRNELPAQPKVVYALILNIIYFYHFLNILENYNPMDDEPMWDADCVVAPTPGSAITIPKTANELAIKVIMEYLVNISKRHAFWSLNEDILKINVLTTNTPYPSRKIRRICACTHQRPRRIHDQYAVSREDKYAVLEIYKVNIMEDIKRGPYSKKPQYAVSKPWIRRINTASRPYKYKTQKTSFKCAKSYSRYLNHKSQFSEEKKSRRGLATHSNPYETTYASGLTRFRILPLEEVAEIMAETMEHGLNHEDANEHIEKVLEIVDLFHIPNITIDQVMLRAFPVSLTGAILDSRGAIPSQTAPDAKIAIKEMVEYSKKWGEIKKVNEKVYAAQVGCEQCKGPHYTKYCPLKEEGKTLEEAYYTQFSGPLQGGGYRVAALGFYQRNNMNPSYQERRQSMEDTLSKFKSELAKRHEENSNLIKEIRASTNERGFRSLPSSTEVNSRDQVKSISTTAEADSYPIRYLPEDIKVPLILGRPFLSTASAKIDVYKRKITLRIGEERIIFKSVKSASSLIKRVYVLSLRERMELDLEARLMGDTLVINRSLDPLNGDYIKLNDLNEPFELRRNQGDDLIPTIEEGEVIEEFKTRDDELDTGIGDYPSYCDHDKKIHIDCAHNLKFSCMIGFEFTHVNFFPLLTFSVVTDFAVLENMDAYRNEGMSDVNDEDENNGISHPYQKLKGFYKGVLNLGPDYIRDVKMEEWLTREHISVHEME